MTQSTETMPDPAYVLTEEDQLFSLMLKQMHNGISPTSRLCDGPSGMAFLCDDSDHLFAVGFGLESPLQFTFDERGRMVDHIEHVIVPLIEDLHMSMMNESSRLLRSKLTKARATAAGNTLEVDKPNLPHLMVMENRLARALRSFFDEWTSHSSVLMKATVWDPRDPSERPVGQGGYI